MNKNWKKTAHANQLIVNNITISILQKYSQFQSEPELARSALWFNSLLVLEESLGDM